MSHIQQILEGYDRCRPELEALEKLVVGVIENAIREENITVLPVQHRIKTRDSLADKLVRRSENFNDIMDIRDLVGARLICYYNDDVDEVASLMEDCFTVDWGHSSDRRNSISMTAFGYVSLHYSCRLPAGKGYPEELCKYHFEIQMRTVLQHAWAEIEHDLGYKNDYELPRTIRRDFSKVAGLLEVADDYFVQIRKRVNSYETAIARNIRSECAEDMPIDKASLSEYLSHAPSMAEIHWELKKRGGHKVEYSDPSAYVQMLEAIGINTIGDLERLITEYRDQFFEIVEHDNGQDKMKYYYTSGILYGFIYAKLIYGYYDKEALTHIFSCSIRSKKRIERRVQDTLHDRVVILARQKL